MILTEAAKNAKKAALMDALRNSMGLVSQACLAVGCARTFYYDCYNDQLDTAFRDEVDSFGDVKTDFFEGKLFEAIQNGDVAALAIFAKSKWAKKRGYNETKEELPGASESGRKLVVFSLRRRPPDSPANPDNLPAII